MGAVDLGVFGEAFLGEVAGEAVFPNHLTKDRGELRMRHRVRAVVAERWSRGLERGKCQRDVFSWGWLVAAKDMRREGASPTGFEPVSPT